VPWWWAVASVAGFVRIDVPGSGRVAVSIAGTTAPVRFTAPASTGGSPITAYTATCVTSNGGATRTASRAATPISVASLTPGKTYTCTVRATNALGTGPASAASTTVRLPG
jgi:hypothetical protein